MSNAKLRPHESVLETSEATLTTRLTELFDACGQVVTKLYELRRNGQSAALLRAPKQHNGGM